MRTLLASLGVAVLAAGALALACPPENETANAAVKGGECSGCPVTQVAATKADDAASGCCAGDKAAAVAATKADDAAASGCCASEKAAAVAATAAADGACASACSTQKAAVASTAPADSPSCCMSADKTAVAATAPGDGECTSVCSSGDTAVAAANAEPEIPAGFPMMTIVVGDEFTHCPLEAAELCKKSDAKPVFMVRGVQYDCPQHAAETYSRLLDAYLIDITTPELSVNGECQECPMTAAKVSKECGKPVSYIVATREFHCPVQAKEVAAKAIEAANAVAMKITVGEKDCQGCTKTAEAVAAKTGESPVYSIGEINCECPIQAKVMLHMSKVMAAIESAKTVEGVAAAR